MGDVNCIAGAINGKPVYEMILNDPILNQTTPTSDKICELSGYGKSGRAVTVAHNTKSSYFYPDERLTTGWGGSNEGNSAYTCYTVIYC